MNIFRFIADMLHLAAILILLYRIKKSRNCIGKYLISLIAWFIDEILLHRLVMQDIRTLLTRLLHEVLGSIHVFHLIVQQPHENILHQFYCLHHIPNEI